MESSTELLSQFREQLRTENAQTLRRRCQTLFETGIEYNEIAPIIWHHVRNNSVADYSWLPAASCVNHADMAAQVELQNSVDKHVVMTFGEPTPEFRRTEPPPPLEGALDELRSRLNDISASNDWLLTERCLLGIAQQSDVKTTLRCIIEQLLRPEYLGTRSGAWWTELRLVTIRCQAEIWQHYGDAAILPVACRNGGRQCAKTVGRVSEKKQVAMRLLSEEYAKLATRSHEDASTFDEVSFRQALSSDDLVTVFAAITSAWQHGATVEQIDRAMTMLCVERHLRAAYGNAKDWSNLRNELMASANIRKLAAIDATIAIQSAFHAAWLILKDRSDGLADEIPAAMSPLNSNASAQIECIIRLVKQGKPRDAMAETNSYCTSGHDGRELLRRLFLDIGSEFTYAGQRCMIEAWQIAENHPERNRILAATVGSEATYRKHEEAEC